PGSPRASPTSTCTWCPATRRTACGGSSGRGRSTPRPRRPPRWRRACGWLSPPCEDGNRRVAAVGGDDAAAGVGAGAAQVETGEGRGRAETPVPHLVGQALALE